MGNNHSEGKRKQWAKLSQKRRTEIMRERALKGWAKKTKEERRAHTLVMEKARLLKLSTALK